ncbi:MAG: hypothetical protein KJ626_06915 [Verrucomicrobia bacterium]|nr:hypothetical protein [Verrucomicrobiota bacterium]
MLPNRPRILMILTSHRLDCFKLCMDMLFHGGSIQKFDKVVLLLNGVVGCHKKYLDQMVADHPEIPWDIISGPRGRGLRISSLQNQCVERYPDSLYFKIDEDTFVSSDWADVLSEAYEAHKDDPDLSLITPVITNNQAGAHYLLNTFHELREEYTRLFDYPIVLDCTGPVWEQPRLADWITRQFLNLEEGTDRLRRHAEEPFKHFSCRFSINCICYDYRHWQEVGGVPEHDEVGWGDWIAEHRKKVVLATRGLCHHYSFGSQQEWMDRSHLLEDIRISNVPDSLSKTNLIGYYGPWITRILPQIPKALPRKLRSLAKRH